MQRVSSMMITAPSRASTPALAIESYRMSVCIMHVAVSTASMIRRECALSLRRRACRRHLEQRGERRAELHFEIARPLDIAGDRKSLVPPLLGRRDSKRLAAIVDDPGNRGKRLGVVDRRRLAVNAVRPGNAA